MPVPSSIADLSQTAASNFPTGGEAPTVIDDYFQAYASYIALLRDGKGHTGEADVASGATCDIGAANSTFVRITGTTTITSLGTTYNGPRFIRFAGALTFTHNASSLVLPGGANITTAAGDTCIAVPIGSSAGWAIHAYQRAGSLDALTSGTAQATTSGTSKDWTSIPSWVKRITVNFAGFSTNGTSNPLIQIGDSGGIEATGYLGGSTGLANGATVNVANYTTGFGINSAAAGNVLHGAVVLTLLDASAFTWVASGELSTSNTAAAASVSGSKSLSAALDRVRVTTVNGSDAFDAGSVNILYE